MSDQTIKPKLIKTNFLTQIIDEDLAKKKLSSAESLITRFPPEPNGYLHIGHAKSIYLNFGLAVDYGGKCNLRFDDTNPLKEDQEFVDAIEKDLAWLGFKWAEKCFSSDYFEQFYDAAVLLIKKGLAYVDDSNAEELKATRGTLTEAGIENQYRSRSIEENLQLFAEMRAGKFADGEKLLRAKIDMASANMNLRDPVLYRIRHVAHHHTNDEWCIYPMYDFAHALSDAIEGITHSICTLEFEDHRPLYDWFITHCETKYQPRQYEFSRLNLQYAITSKRKLAQLVAESVVDGWDDPRMPTISGLRRRGYPKEAIYLFCDRIGVTKADNSIEMSLLEQCARDVLDQSAPRAMAVLDPILITLSNYDAMETLSLPNHPKDESMGRREVPFSDSFWIDRADFKMEADKSYKRLVLNDCVRLRGAYIIKATNVVMNENMEPIEIQAEIIEGSLGKNVEGFKARGVIHWVSALHAVDAEVRLYDRLFTVAHPEKEGGNILDYVNKNSLSILHAKLEPSLQEATASQAFQFEREAYFVRDSKAEKLCFNRVVTLKEDAGK